MRDADSTLTVYTDTLTVYTDTLTVYTDAVGGGFRRLDEAVQWAREYDSELPPVDWRKDAESAFRVSSESLASGWEE